jgi:hypothetical protein
MASLTLLSILCLSGKWVEIYYGVLDGTVIPLITET